MQISRLSKENPRVKLMNNTEPQRAVASADPSIFPQLNNGNHSRRATGNCIKDEKKAGPESKTKFMALTMHQVQYLAIALSWSSSAVLSDFLETIKLSM
ncbi:hypothetical protein STEG23_030309 [Scotinomys teguina]